MGSAIVPKMEVQIEGIGCHMSQAIDEKTDFLAEDQDIKIVGAQKLRMKVQSMTTQTRL
jgi:hypothetical protein